VLVSRKRPLISSGFYPYLDIGSLWNYNPENDDKMGDHWNGENFSWFSRKRALPKSLLYYEQTSPSLDNGGRILPAIVRPYPAKTAGIPLRFEYEMNTGEFIYEWAEPSSDGQQPPVAQAEATVAQPPLTGHPAITSRETEIFVPSLLTARRKLIVHGLGPDDKHLYDISRQTLFIVTGDPGDSGAGKTHRIKVSLDPPLEPMFEVHGFWDDHWPRIIAILVVIFGICAQMSG
jgi:Glycoside hydrolase family 5 C-terminal domain